MGEEIEGFPKAKGRKCFKREGVLIRLSNVELRSLLNRSSRGDTVLEEQSSSTAFTQRGRAWPGINDKCGAQVQTWAENVV